jgi:predicted O-methyltransferase YrrM
MRSLLHLSPRYIRNRIALWWHETKNPNDPWLPKQMTQILNTLLKKDDVGIEFGSGRSTLFFLKKVSYLTSIEHDKKWHALVEIKTKKFKNKLNYLLFDDGVLENQNSKYVGCVKKIKNNSIDFALVDGVSRDHCAMEVLPKIRSGGFIVIDNVNWFLPINPNSYSPGSLKEEEYKTKKWKSIYNIIREWRYILVSNGVTDSAIFFKPQEID